MGLIEQLGGYEKAKQKAENALANQVTRISYIASICIDGEETKVVTGVYVRDIKKDLLEYRRQHNIFEESDKIVFIDDFMHGELMTVAWTRKGEVWMDDGAKRCTDLSMIRHATDAEIKAMRRLR